jgi:hypothetical protein
MTVTLGRPAAPHRTGVLLGEKVVMLAQSPGLSEPDDNGYAWSIAVFVIPRTESWTTFSIHVVRPDGMCIEGDYIESDDGDPGALTMAMYRYYERVEKETERHSR